MDENNTQKDEVELGEDGFSIAQKCAQILMFLLLGAGIMLLVMLTYVLLLLAFPIFIICMVFEKMSLRDIVETTYDTYVGFPLDVAHTIGKECVDFVIHNMVS